MRDYLLTGRTGVGKSSFINYFMQSEVAAVNPYLPCTAEVEPYQLPGVRLFDSPGLAEAGGRNDDHYLGKIKRIAGSVRLMGLVYLTPLGEHRFREEEEATLRKLAETLGPGLWRSARLILTFAADVPAVRRREAAMVRLSDITGCLQRATGPPASGPRFAGFRTVLLVDNVTPDWTDDGRPLTGFFADEEPTQTAGPVAESVYPMISYWEPATPRAPSRRGDRP